jgi:hypothetical protein
LACIKETKLSFFMDMCSNLGWKECTMTEMCKMVKLANLMLELVEN